MGHRTSSSPWIWPDLNNIEMLPEQHICGIPGLARTPQTRRFRLYGSESWGFESLQAHTLQISDPALMVLVRTGKRKGCANPDMNWTAARTAVLFATGDNKAAADAALVTAQAEWDAAVAAA